MGFAGINADELGTQLGVSGRTVRRILADEKHPDYETRQRIAEICGVPETFLHHGFRATTEPSVTERLEALERQIQAILRRVLPPQDLARLLQGSAPTPRPPRPNERH